MAVRTQLLHRTHSSNNKHRRALDSLASPPRESRRLPLQQLWNRCSNTKTAPQLPLRRPTWNDKRPYPLEAVARPCGGSVKADASPC